MARDVLMERRVAQAETLQADTEAWNPDADPPIYLQSDNL